MASGLGKATALWRGLRLSALAATSLLLGGCSGTAVLNALTPESGYQRHVGLDYGAHERQRLDLYVPEGAADAPVVVFFYGGRWQEGERADYRFAAQALASRGYVVAVPDYRLYPEVRFPAFVEDAAAAVAWIHARAADYGGDPGRLVLAGHSAGAHIAALLALDPQYLESAGPGRGVVRAFIGLAGPYDFLPLRAEDLKIIFGPSAERPRSQPINHVDPQAPPMLLLHGRDDRLVEPGNSRRLAQAVTEAGGSARLRLFDNRGHVSLVASLARPLRFHTPVLEAMGRFIDGLEAPERERL
ncbi:alpha/beta hydrolase [Spiribacter halobius]|uniref:Alpha/beta hydrolase n=1 Tax=Sediminicurvatus halobius TaxID=2182432 RepID=A0A2U2MZ92_9GAMM|nr:alpha/beta hydrolase [Spiribacter halobius]PWG62044.1 alpha/beta hydrolase [Spiribacter halobius]UEX78691.1 alpha/beta hydrolase [Spiribacter halobius]